MCFKSDKTLTELLQNSYKIPITYQMGKILKIVNFITLYLVLSTSVTSLYARTARVYGYVVDQDNIGIELVNVAAWTNVQGDNVQGKKELLGGTVTNKNGYYELVLDETDTVVLHFSMIGYTTVEQRIIDLKEVLNINVQMLTDDQLLEEVEVRGIQRTQGTMDRIDASATRVMPDATGGSIESLLITFAGVSQTNELSSQYNVRGGSFDENSVYVNGIEVHRPAGGFEFRQPGDGGERPFLRRRLQRTVRRQNVFGTGYHLQTPHRF